MLYLLVQVFMVPCQNLSIAETAKFLSPEYADRIKLHHRCNISQLTIEKPDEDKVAPCSLLQQTSVDGTGSAQHPQVQLIQQ